LERVPNFIDLVGASGATYRFRRPDGALSSIGGNFVYVRDQDGVPRVVCCGKARSLGWGLSQRSWFSDENAAPDDQLFIRLNAIATTRDGEHEDLVYGLPRPFTIYEMD
jgi:hypothetical protein